MKRLLYTLILGVEIVFSISPRVAGSPFSYSRALKDAREVVVEENALARGSSRPYVRISDSKSFKKAWVTAKIHLVGSEVVRVGDRVEVVCELDGSPTPNVYWIRGEKTQHKLNEILNNGVADASWEGISRVTGKLVIECVTPEDEGFIHCAGVSGGKIEVASTVLTVEGQKGTCSESSKPTITLYASIMFSNLESTVIIPCRASGNPRPETYWLDILDRRITSAVDSRYNVLENGDLVIDHIKWEDMGRYLCVAKSGDNQVSAESFLYPLKPSNDKER